MKKKPKPRIWAAAVTARNIKRRINEIAVIISSQAWRTPAQARADILLGAYRVFPPAQYNRHDVASLIGLSVGTIVALWGNDSGDDGGSGPEPKPIRPKKSRRNRRSPEQGDLSVFAQALENIDLDRLEE